MLQVIKFKMVPVFKLYLALQVSMQIRKESVNKEMSAIAKVTVHQTVNAHPANQVMLSIKIYNACKAH